MTPPKVQVPGHGIEITEAIDGRVLVECPCGLFIEASCNCEDPTKIPDEQWHKHVMGHATTLKRIHVADAQRNPAMVGLALAPLIR
jgi:hypothetical protein